MVEVLPRIAVYVSFLKRNPQIRILAPRPTGRLRQLLKIIDLHKSRIVTGVCRAKTVYLPRSTACGNANMLESQILSKLYRDYIKRIVPSQPRNKLILIRRSRTRRFRNQREIEKMLTKTAKDYNLTYTLFIDNPSPSLNDAMRMFYAAVIIVAPVGAGEANMLFSQPGTFIIEGVCNPPYVNLCFQRLASVLGHHWHGILSRRGCNGVVDVSAASVDAAVRSYLRLWKL